MLILALVWAPLAAQAAFTSNPGYKTPHQVEKTSPGPDLELLCTLKVADSGEIAENGLETAVEACCSDLDTCRKALE